MLDCKVSTLWVRLRLREEKSSLLRDGLRTSLLEMLLSSRVLVRRKRCNREGLGGDGADDAVVAITDVSG